jgi:hypothetical protein
MECCQKGIALILPMGAEKFKNLKKETKKGRAPQPRD